MGRERVSVTRQARLQVEALEARAVPTASGNLWPHPELVTVSFVPDGTNLGGVTSNLFNERTHEKLEATVECIEPLAAVGDDGKRRFTVVAVLEPTSDRLLLGSSVKAEIMLGKKRVYRIILEH